ncbi:MAG: ParB/RepB/Spo0J family partition protein [Bacteroidales bacterium]|nr:MAG: ParB/RepB/Spo0J family partition protein [Bacteroidales bacterium]
MSKKMVLGRGLGALIEGANDQGNETIEHRITSELVNEIDIDKIDANPYQPRTTFDEEALNELAESIKRLGIIQPITVRSNEGKFQLISGERRLRAARIAGLKKIPAYIRTANDQGLLEMALVENIQREDLDSIEVAISYQRLIEECNLTQENLADRVGKKRATVGNYLRLLKLPAEIQLGLREQSLTMGHARALITIDDPIAQLKLYRAILEKDLSVRKAEEEVRALQEKHPEKSQKLKTNRDLPQTEAQLKEHLINKLGWAADIKTGAKGDGKIVISYHNELELQEIIQKFNSLEG